MTKTCLIFSKDFIMNVKYIMRFILNVPQMPRVKDLAFGLWC